MPLVAAQSGLRQPGLTWLAERATGNPV